MREIIFEHRTASVYTVFICWEHSKVNNVCNMCVNAMIGEQMSTWYYKVVRFSSKI